MIEIIPGAYLLPKILSDSQIADLLAIRRIQCHHSDEEGHGGGWDWYYKEQEEERKKDKKKEEKEDKDTDNSNDNTLHSRPDKPHKLTWVAELLWPYVSRVSINGIYPHSVDEMMKLYRLQSGDAVSRHVDDDFEGPNKLMALYSVLIYLNNDYTGGETIFNGTVHARNIPIGGGLLFYHKIPHEGLEVKSGERYVLKTDLFFNNKIYKR